MGKKYNIKYRKGKWATSEKARKADLAKTAWGNLLPNHPSAKKIWKKDTRKYDIEGIDTGPQWAFVKGETFPDVFKYRSRSKLKLTKSGNKKYRRYWY